MMLEIGQKLTQVIIPGLDIRLDLPKFGGGWFGNGLLSGVGLIMFWVFGILLIIWVGITIYGVIKITKSQGEAKDIEEGMTLIKNIWLSIAVGIAFFVVLSVVGMYFGFGSVLEWSTKLSQCGGGTGPFYFKQIEEQLAIYESNGVKIKSNYEVYCCDLVGTPGKSPNPVDYEYVPWKLPKNWVISIHGGVPKADFFDNCKKFE